MCVSGVETITIEWNEYGFALEDAQVRAFLRLDLLHFCSFLHVFFFFLHVQNNRLGL